MLGIGLLGIFFWHVWLSFFNQSPQIISFSDQTFLWLIIPYILFSLSNILRSTFFGTGKTQYVLALSSFANFLIILPVIALIRLGYVAASFETVMAIFVAVFLLDPLLAYLFASRRLPAQDSNGLSGKLRLSKKTKEILSDTIRRFLLSKVEK